MAYAASFDHGSLLCLHSRSQWIHPSNLHLLGGFFAKKSTPESTPFLSFLEESDPRYAKFQLTFQIILVHQFFIWPLKSNNRITGAKRRTLVRDGFSRRPRTAIQRRACSLGARCPLRVFVSSLLGNPGIRKKGAIPFKKSAP